MSTENNTKIEDSIYDISTLLSLCTAESLLYYETKKLQEKSLLTEQLITNVDSKLKKRKQAEILYYSIQRVKESIRLKKEKINLAKKLVFGKKSALDLKQKKLQEITQRYQQDPIKIGESRILLSQNKVILDNTIELLSKKRTELASDLFFVLDIQQEPENNNWTICGLSLDLLYSNKALFQENSAAMGYVVCLIHWVSIYTNTELMFPVWPRSSEPLIYSRVAKRLYKSLVFPLYYTHNAEKPKYEYGAKLLQADVYQIFMNLGIEEYNPRLILANLHKVFIALDI
ncbi:hypothetical protein BB559_003458 [Furculomyces boomerangus]|uniref:Uncharacterized protein n=2 Tax=Harpellales TaxID=61421 RepID=A0A2T9YL28_9FUNG|nr:hypothetical protein BB559_003458 [Furculomyces boomerangus]PWA01450.1 hypothetical protein BB558_002449 [Smittium angustum]